MIGIVDYGVGNLFSLKSSLGFLGLEHTVSGDVSVLERCDRLILPGVGAFGDARDILRKNAGCSNPCAAPSIRAAAPL